MLGPGIPNPMLFAGGDPLDEYRKIERSVRFNPADSPYFTRTPTVLGNRRTWAMDFWIKPGLTTNYHFFTAVTAMASGQTRTQFAYNAGRFYFDSGTIQGAAACYFTSNRLIRDFGAHMNVRVEFDSTQAAAADRFKVKVNGELVTWQSSLAVPLNHDSAVNYTGPHWIGRYYDSVDGGLYPLDGILSEWRLFDGLIPAACSATHPRTGQWRPKADAGAYGTNGVFLDFADGSAASSAALGKDRSGNNNDWTPTNISVAAGAGCDWLLDTPTNNFCTLNPLAWRNGSGQPNYSNGNLDVTNPSGVFATFSLGTMPLPSWETYFEATVLAVGVNTPLIGIADKNILISDFSNQFAYQLSGQKQAGSATPTAYGAAYTTGDVIGVRVKPSANEIEFYKQTGGAGAFVSQGVIALNAGVEYFAYVQLNNNGKLAINFGQRAFNNPSPPAAAQPNSTKLLPVKPGGPMKSASAFVAVTDTGANIAATLAAARAGFGSYIDIIKRREASEGWRWIFSDDPANYLDTSTTAAKAAVPAFSGTSYVGYSLKVSAANGVATGTFVHTNGANSVVSDGLSNARKMVILHRESAGGGDFFAYHPDLTAGKLLYLNNTTAETTDASINTVTASGFTAASTLPSGTYRWISIAELSGFISLNSYIANSSADGPFVNAGLSPAFSLQKSTSGSATRIKDIARTPNNLAQIAFDLNLPAAEDPNANSIDKVSNGIKERANDAMNVSAQKYITLLIAAFTFRYANAR